jgi:hypothetical protein
MALSELDVLKKKQADHNSIDHSKAFNWAESDQAAKLRYLSPEIQDAIELYAGKLGYKEMVGSYFFEAWEADTARIKALEAQEISSREDATRQGTDSTS